MKIIIIGAGISGLSLAWELQREHDVTVLEASPRVGGWIQSKNIEGAIFECGPRSIRGDVQFPLFEELGLIPIEAKASTKYLAVNGHLQKVPDTFLGLFSSSLGRKALLALLSFPFRKKKVAHDESVGSYYAARFGSDFVDCFIDPMMAGIWAASPYSLSAAACKPTFKRGRTIFSFAGGLESLPKAIAQRLSGTLLVNCTVTRIQEFSDHVKVTSADGSQICGDIVVSTIAAHQLQPLIQDKVPFVPRNSVATVSFGFSEPLASPQGFGFLASSKQEPQLLGIVFDSAIFPEFNGPFQTRLSVMLGGERAKDIFSKTESEIQRLARQAVQKYLHIQIEPQVSIVMRAIDAIPAFPVGYIAQRKAFEANLEKRRIKILGSGFYNPSITDSLLSSQAFTKMGGLSNVEKYI
ncbi:MAG TPA: protoporphyrinogen oxidase [Chlamydiales bacterium]|nr:protoporphyrinogen oxidase [Chlamydiales bacterium]